MERADDYIERIQVADNRLKAPWTHQMWGLMVLAGDAAHDVYPQSEEDKRVVDAVEQLSGQLYAMARKGEEVSREDCLMCLEQAWAAEGVRERRVARYSR